MKLTPKDRYHLMIINASSEFDRIQALAAYEIDYVRPLEKKLKEQAEIIKAIHCED